MLPVLVTRGGGFKLKELIIMKTINNRILNSQKFCNEFKDWALDHHEHFACWPGTFTHFSDSGDIDFSEAEVWQAIEAIFQRA